jgi:Trypsin-co-occurring domain 1
MSDIAVPEEVTPGAAPTRRVYPMKVGDAVVYVEQYGEDPVVEADDAIYAVSAPSPTEAFEKASDAIRECVRIVGERIENLAGEAIPAELSVEFSLSFEAKGRASFIPILVQAEATAATGLKVTAVWRKEPASKQ